MQVLYRIVRVELGRGTLVLCVWHRVLRVVEVDGVGWLDNGGISRIGREVLAVTRIFG